MKKYLIAAVAAVAVFALSAFAASLSVNAGTLQAGEDPIDQCTTADVDVSYGTPTFANPGWELDEITLDPGGVCTGMSFSVVLTGTTGTPWATSTETGTFAGSPVTVEFDAPFDAEDATDVHLVIRNAPAP